MYFCFGKQSWENNPNIMYSALLDQARLQLRSAGRRFVDFKSLESSAICRNH